MPPTDPRAPQPETRFLGIDDLPLIDIPPYKPTLLDRIRQRVREWWCARFGHAYTGGRYFDGDRTVHWYQCHRCGDGGSD